MSVFIIEHLYKSFINGSSELNIFEDVNFSLPEIGFVSIVGKSGCGKSTLLNMLIGIEKPTLGKISFGDYEVGDLSEKEFSNFHLNDVSLIFQHYNLFDNLNCLDNVILPLLMKGYSRIRAKKEANKLFKKFGIENLKSRKTCNLSGGEKQRIAILRSIITNPKVIFCDEPTGALDKENSIQIIETLKEISKNTLIVMVSHNTELVKKYSDEIIEIADKNVRITRNFNYRFLNNVSINEINYKNSWSSRFIFKNFKKDFCKNLFSIVASSISYVLILLAIGFTNGSKSSQEEALNKNLSLQYATISETEYIQLENSPVSFKKTKKPALLEVEKIFEDFDDILIDENISYLISDFALATYKNELLNNISFVPILDESFESFGSELLGKGNQIYNGFEEVLVNEECIKLLNEKNPLNKEILISSNSILTIPTNDKNTPFVKETFSFSRKFKICGVIKEFSFLNTPKIFYSYNSAKEFLKTKISVEYTKITGKNSSFYNLLEESSPDSPISSYSYSIFLKNKKGLNNFRQILKEINIEEGNMEINSTALEIQSTYSLFMNSFSSALLVFVCIAFLGTNLILGIISFSTFITNKKETAILTCLGARNKSIYYIYLVENYAVVLFSLIISFFVSCVLQQPINKILSSRFLLENLISIPLGKFLNIGCGLPLLLMCTSFIFSTIFTIIPMRFYRNKSITDELRDE